FYTIDARGLNSNNTNLGGSQSSLRPPQTAVREESSSANWLSAVTSLLPAVLDTQSPMAFLTPMFQQQGGQTGGGTTGGGAGGGTTGGGTTGGTTGGGTPGGAGSTGNTPGASTGSRSGDTTNSRDGNSPFGNRNGQFGDDE